MQSIQHRAVIRAYSIGILVPHCCSQFYSLATITRMTLACRKRGPKQHNLQKAFRSPEREKMQRARRSSSHGSRDYSVDDDVEMEAMAKVWAHPEDLHLFPVSTKCSIYHCHSRFWSFLSAQQLCTWQLGLLLIQFCGESIWRQFLLSLAVVCAC